MSNRVFSVTFDGTKFGLEIGEFKDVYSELQNTLNTAYAKIAEKL